MHGSCAKCPGSSVEGELVAWRTHERARYEVARQAVTPSPEVDTAVAYERPCPACGREALMVATVHVHFDDRPKKAGGWAFCLHCDALPHPRWEQAGLPAAIDRIRALHTDDFGGCSHCTGEQFVPFPCPTIAALDEPKEATCG